MCAPNGLAKSLWYYWLERALEDILKELDFPNKFKKWIMLTVTTVSYKFIVNEEYTRILKAKRGLRQPISLLLFVIVMEYLHRVLQLRNIPDFNFHSKCEKLNINNLSFVNDLLLFAQGDTKSIHLVMWAFDNFSKPTRLTINHTEYKGYFGNVDDQTKQAILNLTDFKEGPLPFRYLWVPITSRKFSTCQCIILVDKIVARVKH